MYQPHFSVKEITPPDQEPVSVAYVKTWCRVDDAAEDQHLADLITLARQICSDYCGRAFVSTQYLMSQDRPPMIATSVYSPGSARGISPMMQNNWPLDPSLWSIKIPRSPLISLDSFTYLRNGSSVTLPPEQYLVDTITEPGRLTPATGSYWPTPDWVPNAVSITFTAGYGAAGASVPARFRMAIAFMVAALYDNPNGGIDAMPPATKNILDNNTVAEIWG